MGLVLLAIVAALAVWAIVARLTGSDGIALRPVHPALTTGWAVPAASPTRTHARSGSGSRPDARSIRTLPSVTPGRTDSPATPSMPGNQDVPTGRPSPSRDPQVADPPETTPPPAPQPTHPTPPASSAQPVRPHCDGGVLGVVERLLGC